jgi:hypothetical protein
MSRFVLAQESTFDINGLPQVGATLDFHNPGLLTDKDTYPTEADALARTNPNPNPVVANGSGNFGNIWLVSDYDVTLKDSTGATIWGPEKVESFATDATSTKLNPLTTAAMTADSRFTTTDVGVSVPETKEFSTGNSGSGIYDIISGTGTDNGEDILAHDTANISFVLRKGREVSIESFGADRTGATDSTAAIQAVWDFLTANGGGIATAGEGTFKYTRLTIVSAVIQRGAGLAVTFFECTDSTTLDANVAFGSSIRKLDDNTRVFRFAMQDCEITTSDQTTFQNIIGINLCACERGDWRNFFVGKFGFGAFVFARAEGGAEGLGFTGTSGQDGNYHTFNHVQFNDCGQFNTDNATLWLLHKANSNKFFGIFAKAGIDDLIVIKNGNDNGFFGGTAESCRGVATLDSALARGNTIINFRCEVASGNAYNITNGANNNFIMVGRHTGISGVDFNIDSASENLNRILGLDENDLRSFTFPPVSDYSTDHNKSAAKFASVNGDVNYPLFIKAETNADVTNWPKMVLYNDILATITGQILAEIAVQNSDTSSSAAGENAAITMEADDPVGNTLINLEVGVGGVRTKGVAASPTTGTGETFLMVFDVDNATLERVIVGAADSGGSGFKVLRIPN